MSAGLILVDRPSVYVIIGKATYANGKYTWKNKNRINIGNTSIFTHKEDTKYVMTTKLFCKKDGKGVHVGTWFWNFTIKATPMTSKDIKIEKIEWKAE